MVIRFEKRTEKAIGWLTGKNPPNFIAVYFEEPDTTFTASRATSD